MRAAPSAAVRVGRGGVVLFSGLFGAVASPPPPAWHPTAEVSTLGKLAAGSVAGGSKAEGGTAADEAGGGGAAAGWPWDVPRAACWSVRVVCSSHACSCACCCFCCERCAWLGLGLG